MESILKITKTIQKLRTFNNASFPILSVYLSVKDKTNENIIEVFQNLLESTLTENEEALIENEIISIIAFLQKTSLKQNIAIFSGGGKLWEVINHDFAIPSQCYLTYSPNTSPLIEALRKDYRYLIILADREKAIYFTIHNNSVERYEEFKDAIVPQKVKSNKEEYYARNNIILRHIENHLHRHLRRISHHVDSFIQGQTISAILIGGHKPLFHKIEKHLNPILQKKIIGEFITELNIPKNDIVKHSKQAIEYIHWNTV